ncbi:protein NPAT isoform X3 [Meriones unguiculatus]|uniref:protein NPAT isoform X3 n=1 Tax=Meriones unguiculatus TaxID=10047 RepID=UPI00293E969C|nr:protein NPAT isoform X3 [Meriones unguiculatus]
MLLPSDVARLVLGYLQQENLTSTCQTFILESSNLKEYAEHCTDEGFIPACLLSLFGKNLTTILNEYVAMKAKETSNDVPTIMSSLWKKLDHTLSQIRSMQSSPGFAAHQRARTRNGIAEIKRQRWLASQAAPVSSELLVLPYASGQFTTSPLVATQAVKPSGQISTPVRSNIVVVNQSQSQNTVTTGESLNIIPGPQERKTHTSLMSPGRRKSESQRKSLMSSGPHSSVRNFQDPNAFAVEKQMVIENAREKILSNKSLQEKLAENINKFLTSDSSTAPVPKQTDSNPTEPETSIDELLGLPNEIHMSEEAIQDILEQTESDPAFQALFDLFDYGKTKNNKNISQSIPSQHMETNPNIVLSEETNITIKSSFETEEPDGQSGQPPFCTSYQNEDLLLSDLKTGNNQDVLQQESQENFSQISSNTQKKSSKTAVPAEQKSALDITFESVSNLSDFNQRGSSECNEHCSELYTSQMLTEAEVAAVEKNSLSPGSAIIIASPVQPVLQGMVGMIPVSVVGQNGNTFSAPPQQVLHMPLAAPVCNRSITQFPIPQKSQKAQALRNKPITGKQVNNLTDLSSLSEACHTQSRTEASDKTIVTECGKKLEESTIPLLAERAAPASKPFESHRRVLCFDSTVSSMTNTQGPLYKITSQNKEKKETSFPHPDSSVVSSTLKPPPNNASKREREKTVPKILSKSETAFNRHTTVKEIQCEKKVSPTEMALESFNKATANKENELCSDGERQKNPDTSKLPVGQQNGSLRNEKTIASLQELTKKQATSSNNKNVTSIGGTVKDLKQEQSKSASSLIAVEILQDVALHSPTNRIADTDSPVPRTPGSGTGEKHREEAAGSMKAPANRRFGEEGSMPRITIPPVTADLPACSPASETGSENSVSMAAHTLMILSRAAIARTTATPLKDNTQQFRTSSRSTTKKRKLEELDERERNSRSSSKNPANSSVPVKKKKIKKKKLPSSFPAGMDVDKFLLSLHYDE